MMRATKLSVGLFVTCFALGSAASASSDHSAERSQKHFSLFSVVTFKNEECSSESTLTGGVKQGTCFTTTECSDKGGMKSGNCASGFGVCCIFLANSGASATISNNRTYLRNSEFPSQAAAVAAVSVAYTLQKMTDDICQIRLDFDTFVIGGVANSQEIIVGATALTHCTSDTLTMVQTGGATMPTLCGALTGEHLYLDLGALAADTSVVTINTAISTTLAPATAARVWDIKTSQIECYASYRAPAGCHRYFTTESGKITSLNFMSLDTTHGVQTATAFRNTGQELANQRITTCIRRSKGMCCTQYQLCTMFNGITLTDAAGAAAAGTDGALGPFSEAWRIDLIASPWVIDSGIALAGSASGLVDGQCSGDYVEIPSSWSGACGAQSAGRETINSRYCGSKFGANWYLTSVTIDSSPVCDCSEPFVVRHSSDLANDIAGTGSINSGHTNSLLVPRGFCLDYAQHPCYY